MKLSTKHIAKILILLLLFAGTVSAQSDSTKSILKFTSDTTFTMNKSPLGAVMRSAIIPGWGQIYNHSYLKAPIIWGLGAWLAYLWIWNNKNYKSALNKYNFYNEKYQNSGSSADQYLSKGYFDQKNFYQDQRDLVTIYMGLTYLLNLVDAYVDAELYDFSLQENNLTNSPMLNIRIKF